MNFLRSLRQQIKDKRVAIQYNYLRNSDSSALKSKEIKNIVPFFVKKTTPT